MAILEIEVHFFCESPERDPGVFLSYYYNSTCSDQLKGASYEICFCLPVLKKSGLFFFSKEQKKGIGKCKVDLRETGLEREYISTGSCMRVAACGLYKAACEVFGQLIQCKTVLKTKRNTTFYSSKSEASLQEPSVNSVSLTFFRSLE